MEYLKQVHDFATKWIDKFRDQKINYIELVDHYMADDCEALGFQMDCGHAFSEKYGNATSKYDELNRVIDEITDISLLGSAIYSQWRYFNHGYVGVPLLRKGTAHRSGGLWPGLVEPSGGAFRREPFYIHR